jgi:hypothetical protein
MSGSPHPDLFIAGVPKAATTTWYEALDRHPQIHMSEDKELRYHDRDLTFHHRVETEEAYRRQFAGADGEHRLGEASPWYYYSETAPRRIRDRVDDPRIIVLLRDPVERLYSLHGQMTITGAEEITDFREALAAQPDRKRGRRLPDLLEPRQGLYYWDIAHYAPHVRRYQRLFDDDELLFVRFEDFTSDPEATYGEICSFLDVDPTVEPRIPSANAHQVPRSPRVRDLLKDPPDPVQRLAAWVPGDWPRQIRDVLWEWNLKQTDRAPLASDLRRKLTEHCRPDVEEVEDLLGWDLTDWKQVPEPASQRRRDR